MFRLVECKNPRLIDAIKPGRRYNNTSDIPIFKKNGIKLCKWCCAKRTPTSRHSYCSDKCAHSANVLMAPQSKVGLVYLLLRQKFKCAHCDYSWKETFREIYRHLLKHSGSNKNLTAYSFGHFLNGVDYKTENNTVKEWQERLGITPHRAAQCDHIIPLWDGGSAYGFENLQALCGQCHTIKSSKETTMRRAAYKKDLD